MTQLVRSTNEVIADALYLLSELGESEPLSGFMIKTGVSLINELFEKFTLDSIYIPYFNSLTFNFVIGQGEYTLSDMITSPDVSTNRVISVSNAFFKTPASGSNAVVYTMTQLNETNFYQSLTQDVFTGLPNVFFIRAEKNQTRLVVYPQPDQAYECTLICKLMLDSVTANQDLSLVPPYYYGFLKYALARRFLGYYPSGNWSEMLESEYQEYYSALKGANPLDMTITPTPGLSVTGQYYIPDLRVI